MATSISGIQRSSLSRMVRKVEAPRPLKSSSSESKVKSPIPPIALSAYSIESVDKVVTLLDMVANAITHSGEDSGNATAETSSLLTSNILHLCKHLKAYGPQLENTMYRGQLDQAFLIFRNAMVNGTLEYLARLNLLEILELRERSWIPQTQSPGKNYLNSPSGGLVPEADFSDVKTSLLHYPSSASESTTNLAADEVLRRSGKHRDKPSRIPSKNYCKDEIVIRNSDSGKVMGIKGRRVHMIEQLSETIISFQRVASTAKERLVQITGPNEEKISYAERLIEDTIRNNASPVRELFESDSSCSSEESSPEVLGGEDYEIAFENVNASKQRCHSNGNIQPYQYKHEVIVGDCQLTITGDDYTYVTVAKAELDEYFNKLRKSGLASEDVDGEEVFMDKKSRPHQDAVKISSSSHEKEVDFALPTSEPVDIASTASFECSYANKLSALTKALLTSSTLNVLPGATDTMGSAGMYDDMSNTDPKATRDANEEESKTIYTKEFILQCRESEFSRGKPQNWDVISSKFPNLVKNQENEPIIDVEG